MIALDNLNYTLVQVRMISGLRLSWAVRCLPCTRRHIPLRFSASRRDWSGQSGQLKRWMALASAG